MSSLQSHLGLWQSILTRLLRPIVLAMTNLPLNCEQNFQILRGNP
ncbi:hypothetical protein HFN_0572 [Helicobacter fennelliae MRY12-0050]|uniref:Uncharacterized protein n=1 Tax=Helicobacter fennelliae MRY12-0050 TaxID=1325130 RepID=T1D2L5_9HELI|nr:hypothetical protein HFN_0572 [Helicobacter fennelliae MRY12-0050]